MTDLVLNSVVTLAKNKVEAAEKCWGRNHANVISELINLAELYASLKMLNAAKTTYWRVLDIQYKLFGPLYSENARTLVALAELYEIEGELLVAEQLFEEALCVFDSDNTFINYDCLGTVLLKLHYLYTFTNNELKLKALEGRVCAYLNQKFVSGIRALPSLAQIA